MAATVVLSSVVTGQETIPELVRKHHGQLEGIIHREFSPVGLTELVKSCDLIARVVVLDARSRLSEDERSMHSDYSVQVLDQYFSRRVLDPAENIVVTKPGGTMTIDGYQYAVYEHDFPALQSGEEYILFLKFDPSIRRYIVPDGAQGAFTNVGGIVEQVSGIGRDERGGVPIAEFTDELTDIIKSR